MNHSKISKQTGTQLIEGKAPPYLSKSLIWVMAIGCGASVANLYYNQPLLADIAQTFHATSAQIGHISMLTQLGFALGLFLFVPLGDIRERRGLIVSMLIAVSIALLGVALSQNLVMLGFTSLAVGATTVVPQMIVPLAAQLADPKEQGKVVGLVMSGLFFGILLARTVSGFVGHIFGWRAMFFIAPVIMIVLALILRFSLPESRPSTTLTYTQLLHSLWELILGQPILREASMIGGLLFGAFSAFWTTMVFFLRHPPYHYGAEIAGLFGLVGLVGALIAPIAGRLADKKNSHRVVGGATVIVLLAYAVFWLEGHHIWGLIVGVILLDLGVQGAHISNQTRVYRLMPEAKNRVNTVYMVSYFLGGSIGSLLGTYGWSLWGWNGVCLVGSSMVLACLVIWGVQAYKKHYVTVPVS